MLFSFFRNYKIAFLKSNKIRDPYLKLFELFISFSFVRAFHSCESALHELISFLNETKNKKLIALLLFIDFKKAFDLVDSDLLIKKLCHYGFSNESLDLIKNYFFNRQPKVKIKASFSDLLLNLFGVPEGSVLGRLFFIIFING
jgi:hypothetical protein